MLFMTISYLYYATNAIKKKVYKSLSPKIVRTIKKGEEKLKYVEIKLIHKKINYLNQQIRQQNLEHKFQHFLNILQQISRFGIKHYIL
ncbi:unnamed protein product [Paramecium octaurelia]|uniref:Uncharacterized protein n=1 Tax=Paramecium octaurelia TaxID=43137 RepID=A0A8S1XRW9_PAROT|nr:unnamed protein product [Paramecium octaurelia]